MLSIRPRRRGRMRAIKINRKDSYLVYYVLEGPVCGRCASDDERMQSDTWNTRTRHPWDKRTAICNRCHKQI
jgi:hypothetical protein